MPSDQLILIAVFNTLNAISTFEMNEMRFLEAYIIDGLFSDARFTVLSKILTNL